MSEITNLIDALTARGVTLGVEAGRLWFEPADQVTPGLLDRLRTHKAELLAHLTEPQTTIRCPWCRATDLAERPEGWLCDRCKRLAWVASTTDDYESFTRADCTGRVVRDFSADEPSEPTKATRPKQGPATQPLF